MYSSRALSPEQVITIPLTVFGAVISHSHISAPPRVKLATYSVPSMVNSAGVL